MMIKHFKGIWPVLTIPFLDNKQLDEASFRKQIRFLLEKGVDGLVIFGLASEIYKLSERERETITEITVSEVQGKVPIIAGTEHTGSEVAAERSFRAQELGVSGVMVYPPTFVKPDRNDLFDYYQQISDRIHIPIMIQDAQAWTGVPLPTDVLVQMNREIPQVQYVKIETAPTGPKMTSVINKSSGKISVFGGLGGLYYLEEMKRGAVGTLIPPVVADRFLEIHNNYHAGRYEDAEFQFHELLPFLLFEINSLDTLIEIQKLIFCKAGIFKTSVMRKPHVSIDSFQYQQLQHYIDKYNIHLTFRS